MLDEPSTRTTPSFDDLIREIGGTLERSLPTYAGLSQSVKEEIRGQVTELIQRTAEHVTGARMNREELYAFARRMGRSRALQGIPLGDLIRAFFLVESIVWGRLIAVFLDRELSAEEWLAFFRSRGEINAELVAALSASYLETRDALINRQLRELHGLLEVGRTISSTMDLDRVFIQILEVATEIMQAPMGAVYLMEGGELELVAQIGLSSPWTKGRKVDLRRSLLARAIEEKAPVSGLDEHLRGLALPAPARGGRVRSAISCPIMKDDVPIGGLELYDVEARNYHHLDLALLAAFAPQAGVAIENARLFWLERRRSRQMELMKEMAEETAGAVSFGQAVAAVLRKIAEVASVDKCLLFLYHREEDKLEFVRGHGLTLPVNRRMRGVRWSPGEIDEMTVQALRKGETVIVEDAEGDPRVNREHLGSFKIKSCMALPLVSEREVTGIIYLGDSRRRRIFDRDEVEMIEAMAAQAGVAILQAQLRQRIRVRERRLQELEASERVFHERERSEAIVSANPDAIVVVDRQRNIVLFNPAAGELFGWREEEALGRHVHEILYGEENPLPGACMRKDCPVEAAFRGEKVTMGEMEYRRRDGGKVWISGSFSVIRDRKRQITSVICNFRDISEQKRLQHLALVEKELDIAAHIQGALLPEGMLENETVAVMAHMEQARIVGGDWYDYWEEGGRLVFVVGDAAGSGIPAALLATLAMSAIRAEAKYRVDILDVVRKANLAIFPHRLEDRFITIIYGELDLATLQLRYVNAGHNDPYLIRGGGEVITLSSDQRSILGAFEDIQLQVETVQLEPGDRLFLYTDGVIDCRDSKRRQFGEKRLRRYLRRSGSRAAASFIAGLVEELRSFSGGRMEDDFTVLVCDVKR
jgi:sigma-B regulation protein RsbU (phosphoserine phosphatase)